MRFEHRIYSAGVAMLMLSACAVSPQAKEAKYLKLGQKEFEKKNYGVAILDFKNAAAAQPMDAEPYYQLGLANLAANDVNTAASYFRKARGFEPQAHRCATEAGGTDVHEPKQGVHRGGAETLARGSGVAARRR